MVSQVALLCSAALVIGIVIGYFVYRWIRYGNDYYIVRLSFLELAVYQRARGLFSGTHSWETGRPMGKVLYKHGGLLSSDLKVYSNGITGKYGELTTRTMGTGGFRMNDHVVAAARTMFVPFDQIEGIYPIEYSYQTPSGGLYTKSGLQIETKDHMIMTVTFEKEQQAAFNQFKAALGRYQGTYRHYETIGGLLQLTGTTDNLIPIYSGDLYRPKVLRDARDDGQGQRGIPNSQLKPGVVMALGAPGLSINAFPEWVQYWSDWLRGSRSKKGEAPDAIWLEERYSLLVALIDQLEEARRTRRDVERTSTLYNVIASELVKDHCTYMVDDREEVDRDICDLAGSLVQAAKVVNPSMGDLYNLGSRIETLKRQM